MEPRLELLDRCAGAFCGNYVDQRATIARLHAALEEIRDACEPGDPIFMTAAAALPSPSSSAKGGVMKSFYIEWGGNASLTVDEIWPNGDAPADPTREDVIEAMRNSASTVRQLCCDWDLDVEGIEVDGKDSGLR